MTTDRTSSGKVWRVRPKDGGAWLIEPRMITLGGMLDDMVEGTDEFILERVEMTESELAEVGEFDGW